MFSDFETPSIRNSTFDIRYSIFLQSFEPMDYLMRNPYALIVGLTNHLQPRAKPWLLLGYRSAVLRIDRPCIFYRSLPPTEASLLRTSLSALPAPLPLAPERGIPSHHRFLKTNSYQDVLRLPNSFLRNSTFDIRYSIFDFIKFSEPWLFNENPYVLIVGLRITSNHGQNRGYCWATALRFCE